MVRYKTKGIGCVLILKATGKTDREMSIEQLEEIDDIMLEIGSSRTGQRVEVDTTTFEDRSAVEYAYQESIHHRSIEVSVEQLGVRTVLQDPVIFVDVSTAEFKEEKNG